jgi:hypothetical protein
LVRAVTGWRSIAISALMIEFVSRFEARPVIWSSEPVPEAPVLSRPWLDPIGWLEETDQLT